MHVKDGVVYDIGLKSEKESNSQDNDNVGDVVDEVEKTASDEKGSAEKGISASDMEKNGMKEIEDYFVAKYVSEKIEFKIAGVEKGNIRWR